MVKVEKKAKDEPARKGPEITRNLLVKLTEPELLERGQALSLKRREQREVEAAKKDEAATRKKQLDEIGAEIDRLATIVREKAETRPVRCEERREYSRNVIEIVRTDIGLVVETHVMTEAERQTLMFEKGPQAISPEDSAEDRQAKKTAAGKEAAKVLVNALDKALPLERRFLARLDAAGDREGLSDAQVKSRFREFCREAQVRGDDRREHLWEKVRPLLANPAPAEPAAAGTSA